MADKIGSTGKLVDPHVLLTYIANLELEIDRLRKQYQLIEREAREFLKRLHCSADRESNSAPSLNRDADISEGCKHFGVVLSDLAESTSYDPATDVAVPISLKPLIEHVFHCQQRLWDASHIVLRLELESELIEWFPSRLQHILNNLISNAIRYRDPEKGESRVTLTWRALAGAYELRLSDNGLGMTFDQSIDVFELIYRSAPERAAGLGVGLAVAKLLVEQTGGTLLSDSNHGQGASVVAILPRFDVDDFLERASTSYAS